MKLQSSLPITIFRRILIVIDSNVCFSFFLFASKVSLSLQIPVAEERGDRCPVCCAKSGAQENLIFN